MTHLVTGEDIQIARDILTGFTPAMRYPARVDKALAYELNREWLLGDRTYSESFITKFDFYLDYLINLNDKCRASRAFSMVLFEHGISIPLQHLSNWQRFVKACGSQISAAGRKKELLTRTPQGATV